MPPKRRLNAAEQTGDDATDLYTREEIGEAIQSFSDVETARIHMLSRFYAVKSGIDADEITSRATYRLIENSCQRRFSIFSAYLGVMRSIASSRDSRARSRLGNEDEMDFESIKNALWQEETLTPEQILISKDQYNKLVNLVRKDLKNNTILSKLFEGHLQGLRGEDLRNFAGLSRKAQDSCRKTLRGRLNKLKDRDL